jgi:hypothetical protein
MINSCKLLIPAFCLFFTFSAYSQKSSTPLSGYTWKKGRTVAEAGYVIIKSGKKLDGIISLKGSTAGVTEITYEGQGKKIDFPPAALQSYGLLKKENSSSASTKSGAGLSGPINESSEGMYNWKFMGIIMDKEIHVSEPRDGYVILKSGKKHEGDFKLKKKDGVLTNYEIKPATGKKVKGGIDELARYGYNVSESKVMQANLMKSADKFTAGTVDIGDEILRGSIYQEEIQGKFYSKKIIFMSQTGQLSEYTPETAPEFTLLFGGGEIKKKYISAEGTYVPEEFDGHVFKMYRNPFPTTINRFATDLAKAGVQAGTTAAAEAIINKDAKDNNYTTNMDSLIRVSSTEELIKLRDGWVKLAGYSSADEVIDNSDNESLKNNVSALELAIAGREMASSEGGILNKEWVILNKNTGEKTIIYKGEYKDLMEPLLKGCLDYLTMDKSDQNQYKKWGELQKALELLDVCY